MRACVPVFIRYKVAVDSVGVSLYVVVQHEWAILCSIPAC